MKHFDKNAQYKYTKEEIRQIKEHVNIVSFIEKQGINLQKSGKGYMGLCPFHDDKNPSLSVNEKEGVFHCFGCGASGDVIEFARLLLNVSFKEAVNYLAYYVGVKLHADSKSTDSKDFEPRSLSAASVEANREPELTPEEEEESFTDREKQEALKRVVEIYTNNLAEDNQALKYLKSGRGIFDNETIRGFNIGYSNGNLEQRIAPGSKDERLLKDLGILNDDAKEVFKGCLTFPIISEKTGIGEIYARAVNDNRRLKHLYLKGSHVGVFNEKAFKVYDEIILCECIIDALSLFVNGFKNVSCLYGLNGMTEELRTLIKESNISKVYFAFDNEDKAKEKAKEYSKEFNLTSKWIELPAGIKDINEYFVKGGYSAEHFTELISTSVLLQLKEDRNFDYEGQLTDVSVNYSFHFEEYVLEVKGIPKKNITAPLKVGIKATYLPSSQFQYDTIDLFSSRSRNMFVNATADLFGVSRDDLASYLVEILSLIEKLASQRVDSSENSGTGKEKKDDLTEEEIKAGLKFLKSKNLTREIVKDMSTTGYVGEDRNKLLAYLIATSRKLDDPLSAIVVSRHAAGKSMLIDTTESFMPPEDVISITSASDQAFFYFKDGNLRHKFVTMGEHEGMENIEYHIRELLSKKEISKMVPRKNEQGEIETVIQKVQGPISFVLTSTSTELNEENLSRYLVLYVDESREQTNRIIEHQNAMETIKGQSKKVNKWIILKKHHIAQKLLKKVTVNNPFAPYIHFPTKKLEARRDHKKFLRLIAVITFLHQYQREVKVEFVDDRDLEYIECTIGDYRIAYDLFMHGILQNTISDIPKMARDLHKAIKQLRGEISTKEKRKEKDVLFTRKMLVDHTGYTFAQVRNYMRVLEENEIVEISNGQAGVRKKIYRLIEEDLENINLSMIPSPDEMLEKIKENEENR